MKLFSKILISLVSAAILMQAVQARSPVTDPCDNLSGNWAGVYKDWHGGYDYFVWNVDVNAQKMADVVTLQFKFTKSLPRKPEVYTGTCQNGEIVISQPVKISGNIIDNQIALRNLSIEIELNKA